MNNGFAVGGGALFACLLAGAAFAQDAQRKPLFADGECSGVLCSTIGGSQAPQAQPRKSLFPEGQCGGVLCAAIGGSQAPAHAEPPPPCGGGLLCDMAPYAMGQPFIQAQQAPPPAAAPTVAPPVVRHAKKTRRRTAQAK